MISKSFFPLMLSFCVSMYYCKTCLLLIYVKSCLIISAIANGHGLYMQFQKYSNAKIQMIQLNSILLFLTNIHYLLTWCWFENKYRIINLFLSYLLPMFLGRYFSIVITGVMNHLELMKYVSTR